MHKTTRLCLAAIVCAMLAPTPALPAQGDAATAPAGGLTFEAFHALDPDKANALPKATLEVLGRMLLAKGDRLRDGNPLRGIRGSCILLSEPPEGAVLLPSYEECAADKRKYALATRTEYAEHDPVRGKALIQQHDKRYLIVNPPAMPLTAEELDFVAELPYTREYHPMYEEMGGVPAIEEVRFSVIHNRGCFGGCNFCSLAFHQGRFVTSRSKESIIREAELMTEDPRFKGYIHDVGGPSANFRRPSCDKQITAGLCAGKKCIAPNV